MHVNQFNLHKKENIRLPFSHSFIFLEIHTDSCTQFLNTFSIDTGVGKFHVGVPSKKYIKCKQNREAVVISLASSPPLMNKYPLNLLLFIYIVI